ncbi:MAG: 3-hydroxylacyl-ACP dehydratase [Gemmatimonas sp.]
MTFPLDAAQVVPHSSAMLLLDTVMHADANTLVAHARVRASCPLAHGGAVGAWTGIEFMAQAIAAFEGCRARLRGEGPKVGFLIGSRHYSSSVSEFPADASLRIEIARQYEDSGLGLFDGRIIDSSTNTMLAEATLSVFQPDNAEQFLLEGRL